VSARAALLAVATLLGCAEVRDGATVVRLWAMGREGEMVERLVADFERDNPDIRVRVQQIPWSAAHEKLLTAYVGDAVPDVLQAGNTWLPELVALEALEPLDAWIARPDGVDAADYFPGILATNVVDGTTWGVPWYVDTRVLFYRSDLLAAAGCRPPEGAVFSGVSGRSSTVPSIAISRSPNRNAPGNSGGAAGPASRPNSKNSGRGPSRWRAWVRADLTGGCQARQGAGSRSRRPSTRFFSTSGSPSRAHNPSPIPTNGCTSP